MSDAIVFKFGADSQEFYDALNKMRSELTALSKASARTQASVAKLGEAVGSMKNLLMGAAGLWGIGTVVTGVQRAYSSLVSDAASAEKAAVSFEVLMNGAERAKEHVAALHDYAEKTPFRFEEISAGSKKLLAFGVEAKKSHKVLRQLGDIAAVSGASLEELADVYGKIAVSGLDMERVNQLGDKGVNVIADLAALHGISVQKVVKGISEKKFGLSDIDRVLELETGEGGRFAGGTMKLSQTTEGKISTLEDNITAAKVSFGGAMVEALKEPLDELTAWIAGNKETMAEMGQSVAAGFKWALLHAKEIAQTLAAVVGVIGVGKVGSAVIGIKTTIASLSPVFAAIGTEAATLGKAIAAVSASSWAAAGVMGAAAAAMVGVTMMLMNEATKKREASEQALSDFCDSIGTVRGDLDEEAEEETKPYAERFEALRKSVEDAKAAGDLSALYSAMSEARSEAMRMRNLQGDYSQGSSTAAAFKIQEKEADLEQNFEALAEAAGEAADELEIAAAKEKAAREEKEREAREKRIEAFRKRLEQEDPEGEHFYKENARETNNAKRWRGLRERGEALGIEGDLSNVTAAIASARANREAVGLKGEDTARIERYLSALEQYADKLDGQVLTKERTRRTHDETVQTNTLLMQGKTKEADEVKESYAYLARVAALVEQGFTRRKAETMAREEMQTAWLAKTAQTMQQKMPTMVQQSGASAGNGGATLRLGGQSVEVARQHLAESRRANDHLSRILSLVDTIKGNSYSNGGITVTP